MYAIAHSNLNNTAYLGEGAIVVGPTGPIGQQGAPGRDGIPGWYYKYMAGTPSSGYVYQDGVHMYASQYDQRGTDFSVMWAAIAVGDEILWTGANSQISFKVTSLPVFASAIFTIGITVSVTSGTLNANEYVGVIHLNQGPPGMTGPMGQQGATGPQGKSSQGYNYNLSAVAATTGNVYIQSTSIQFSNTTSDAVNISSIVGILLRPGSIIYIQSATDYGIYVIISVNGYTCGVSVTKSITFIEGVAATISFDLNVYNPFYQYVLSSNYATTAGNMEIDNTNGIIKFNNATQDGIDMTQILNNINIGTRILLQAYGSRGIYIVNSVANTNTFLVTIGTSLSTTYGTGIYVTFMNSYGALNPAAADQNMNGYNITNALSLTTTTVNTGTVANTGNIVLAPGGASAAVDISGKNIINVNAINFATGGTLVFKNAGGFTTTLSGTAATASATYVFPAALPAVAGYFMASDASGNMSWTNSIANLTVSGTLTAPAITSAAAITLNPTTSVAFSSKPITGVSTIALNAGSGAAYPVTLQGSASATVATTYTLPVGYPTTSGYFLAATTGGVMSWTNSIAALTVSSTLTTPAITNGTGAMTFTAGSFSFNATINMNGYDITQVANVTRVNAGITIGQTSGSTIGSVTINPIQYLYLQPGSDVRILGGKPLILFGGTGGYCGIQATANGSGQTYTLPAAYPAVAGYFMASDAAGVMSWTNSIANLTVSSTLTTPSITGAALTIASSSGAITLNPTTSVAFSSKSITGVSTIALNAGTGAAYPVTLQGAASATVAVTYTLPVGLPATTGYFMASDTAGVMSWTNSIAALTVSGALTTPSITTASGDLTLNPVGNVAFSGKSLTGVGGLTFAAGNIMTFTSTTGGFTTSLSGASATASVAYILPVAPPGVSGYFLSATTAGAMSWTNSIANFTVSGTLTTPAITSSGAITLSPTTSIACSSKPITGISTIALNAGSGGGNPVTLQGAAASAAATTYTLPVGYPGVAGYFMASDVSGVMSWTNSITNFTVSGTLTSGTLNAGTLQMYSNIFTTTSGGISISPTNGITDFSGGALNSVGSIQLGPLTYKTTIQNNAALAANVTYTLPPAAPTATQMLTSTTGGAMAWATIPTSAIISQARFSQTAFVTATTASTILTFNTSLINGPDITITSGNVINILTTGTYMIMFRCNFNVPGSSYLQAKGTVGGANTTELVTYTNVAGISAGSMMTYLNITAGQAVSFYQISNTATSCGFDPITTTFANGTSYSVVISRVA